jgi:ATPase subunit of ABC transporter with duplicated ATPase domains
MIVTKDIRADVLGEPIFEKVNLVVQSGERIGVMRSQASTITTFLRILSGDEESDAGTVLREGERVQYVSSETMNAGKDVLAKLHHTRPTFLLLDAMGLEPGALGEVRQFITSFRGGILLASNDASLMLAAKTTRVFELQASTKSVASFTGSYAEYLVEREKNIARVTEAYEKQQKEKRRLEDWLTQKREEAAIDRSPAKGATIRTKAKYLKREVLDKEIPKPDSFI